MTLEQILKKYDYKFGLHPKEIEKNYFKNASDTVHLQIQETLKELYGESSLNYINNNYPDWYKGSSYRNANSSTKNKINTSLQKNHTEELYQIYEFDEYLKALDKRDLKAGSIKFNLYDEEPIIKLILSTSKLSPVYSNDFFVMQKTIVAIYNYHTENYMAKLKLIEKRIHKIDKLISQYPTKFRFTKPTFMISKFLPLEIDTTPPDYKLTELTATYYRPLKEMVIDLYDTSLIKAQIDDLNVTLTKCEELIEGCIKKIEDDITFKIHEIFIDSNFLVQSCNLSVLDKRNKNIYDFLDFLKKFVPPEDGCIGAIILIPLFIAGANFKLALLTILIFSISSILSRIQENYQFGHYSPPNNVSEENLQKNTNKTLSQINFVSPLCDKSGIVAKPYYERIFSSQNSTIDFNRSTDNPYISRHIEDVPKTQQPTPKNTPRTSKNVYKIKSAPPDSPNAQNIGLHGELLVMRYEQNKLLDYTKDQLSQMIHHRSQETNGDRYGFDIESRTLSGDKLYIEVKSTEGGKYSDFTITKNEYRKMKELSNSGVYAIYRVYDISKNPKVDKIIGLKEIKEKLEFSPIDYSFRLSKEILPDPISLV